MAKVNFQKIILHIIKAGIEPFAAPKHSGTLPLKLIVKLIEEEIYKDLSKKSINYRKYNITRTYKKLIADREVILGQDGYPYLAKKGEQHLINLELDDYAITIPDTWDGKYRIIIFNISEQKSGIRTALRRQLVAWKFIRLQNSVWVNPYECQEAISLLKAAFGVVADVLYITAESIENDNWLKKEFGLI